MKSSLRYLLLSVLLVTALGQGCNLSTPAPTGVVLPSSLDGKDSLPILLAGAIGDFAVAYAGNNPDDGLILLSGLMADELSQNIGTSSNVDIDQRVAGSSNSLSESVYRSLQRARASAEQVVGAYQTFDSTALGGMYARNLAGFAYVVLAEAYCGGIPFSRAAPDGTVVYGQAESTSQILGRAVAAFDTALVAAQSLQATESAVGDSIAAQVNLARVGRARSLLALDRFAEANVEAANVPDGFAWLLEYSHNSQREVNGVNYHISDAQDYSLADSEGVNGIAFLAARDPRAQVDPSSDAPLKYDDADAPIVLASTTEARLIQAEALLQAGDASGSLGMLNALRASIGLTPLSDPSTPDGRITQLFRERAFWLWLTGHRLGDLRRLVRHYGRSPDTVYPVGLYAGGPQKYGNQLELAVYEVNNPRYDPAACDPSQP
jgi:hypothetical protein